VFILTIGMNRSIVNPLNEHRELAESVALQTSDYMTKLRNDLRTLASIVPLSPQGPNSLTRLLYSVQQNNPAFMDLAIVGPDGIDRVRVTRADVSNTGLLNRARDEAFRTALRGESYVSPVAVPEQYPEQTLAYPIISESGSAGAVIARIDLTTLWVSSLMWKQQRGYAY
jgi:hypothetical protein